MILLVDDDPGVRRVYCDVLKEQGYECEAVGDGFQALAALYGNLQRFDAAIIDLILPGLDGATLTKIIRTIERRHQPGRRTRIILTTGFSPDRVGVEVLVAQVDCDDFVPKPSSAESIIRAVSGS